jgi:YVTN family beta-propeller protein
MTYGTNGLGGGGGSGWSGTSVSTGGSGVVIVSYATPTNSLYAYASPGGSVSCAYTSNMTPTPCIASYQPGTRITATATPYLYYSFVGWTGFGFGNYTGTSNVANVVIDGPIGEVANFTNSCVPGGGLSCITVASGANAVTTFSYVSSPGAWNWTVPAGVTQVQYLVVAGGGGGGYGGGGGAGGFLTGNLAVTSGNVISITVGAGGGLDANGANSVLGTVTPAIGGGHGTGESGGAAGSGGSGGGAAGAGAGSGTSGQGNNGANGANIGGGGGGAGAAGTVQNGGAGLSSAITGNTVYYAGGGGGGGSSTFGTGGSGGGGTGSTTSTMTYGTNGLGGGGGSGWSGTSVSTGGSGVVILKYFVPTNSLTATASAGGTVSCAYASNSVTTSCVAAYSPGTQIKVTASPLTGFALASWACTSGACSTTSNSPTVVTVNGMDVVTASFSLVAGAYAPVTLTNSQSSATPIGFEASLNVPSSSYSIYINSGWRNVEFTVGGPASSGGTPLYAWVESNSVNTAANTLVWVNLGGVSVPANNALTIYMNFMPSNVMNSTSSYTGEAPTLPAAYGQYDNGNAVFNYYQEWGGLSALPAGWANNGWMAETYLPTYTAFKSTTTSTNCWAMAYESTPSFFAAYPYVYDTYATIFKGAGTNQQDCSGTGNPGTGTACNPSPGSCGGYAMGGWDGNSNGNPFYFTVDTGFTGPALLNSPEVYSLYAISSTSLAGTLNYGTKYADAPGATTPTYEFVGLYTGAFTSADAANYIWTRGREYPPNGIMPTASFGGVSATFAPAPYSLSATAGANGAVSCAYAYNGTAAPCTGNYLYGTPITVTATPNSGYRFFNWTCSGGSCSTLASSPVNVVVTANTVVTASFATVIYVPITLTDSQSSGTLPGFQQMLSVPSSSYSSYINSGWKNVEFTAFAPIGTAGNVPLYAWVESNAINTASNTIVWVNLGNDWVSANNFLTLYLNIMPSNVMNSATAYTGEAPQLSTTYGQYDNGALVFSYYQEWGGLSALPSGWNNNAWMSETYQPTYTTLKDTTSTTNCWGMAYATAPSAFTTYPYVYDAYATLFKGAGTNHQDCTGIGNQGTGSACNPAPGSCGGYVIGGWDDNVNGDPLYLSLDSADIGPATPNLPAVYSMYAASNTALSGTLNYGTAYSISTSVTAPTYLLIGAMTGVMTTQDTMNYYWARTRAYPPSGVMPAASFGSVSSASPSVMYPFSANAQAGGAVSCAYASNSVSTSCSTNYPAGTQITANAAASNSVYAFTGWTCSPAGSCSTTSGNPTLATVNNATRVTANFYTQAPQVVNTISVCSDPYGVALSPSGALAYIACVTNSQVQIVNTATYTVVNMINVGSTPYHLAVSPDGSRVYVANNYASTVSVINTATDTVINTITVGSSPYDVAFSPSGALAYVTLPSSNSLKIINVATNTVVNTIGVGNAPYAISVEPPSGNFLYLEVGTSVDVVNTATNSLVKTFSCSSAASDIAITPNGALGYVTNGNGGGMSVFNVATNATVATLLPTPNSRGVAFTPSGKFAYAGQTGVDVYNVAANVLAYDVAAAGAEDLAVSPDGNYVYATGGGYGAVLTVISTGTYH